MKKPKPLEWATTSQFYSMVTHNNKRLGLAVQTMPTGEWNVMAFQTPEENADIHSILDNHQHKVIGSYPSPALAFQAAESFAAAWIKGFKATESTKCECVDNKES